VTEAGSSPSWISLLRGAARNSSHETRNALNALVVNLEVVRSRTDASDFVMPFLDQAVAQSEESVRMAASSAALLELLLGAVDSNGTVQCEVTGPFTVRLRSQSVERERLQGAIEAASARTGIRADSDAAGIIFTFPPESPAETNQSE